MRRLITLICGCDFHEVEIEEYTLEKIPGNFISIRIYEYKSMKTGKIYKKSKLLGDVVLLPDQVELFKSIFKNGK